MVFVIQSMNSTTFTYTPGKFFSEIKEQRIFFILNILWIDHYVYFPASILAKLHSVYVKAVCILHHMMCVVYQTFT